MAITFSQTDPEDRAIFSEDVFNINIDPSKISDKIKEISISSKANDVSIYTTSDGINKTLHIIVFEEE